MSEFKFKYHTTRFNLLNALSLAECCQVAYSAASGVRQKMVTEWKFDDAFFFDKNDTQAFIAFDDRLLLVVFRGTESIKDWLTDFDAKLIKHRVGKIHRGFYKALNQVWREMHTKIRALDDPRRQLFLTGHSLGGALATLAAERLLAEERTIHGIYTYGQPRAGNGEFAADFNRQIKHRFFRFVNNEDYVTRVPPRLAGYRHVGTPFYIDNQGEIHRSNIAWRKFLDNSQSATIRSEERYQELRHQYPGGADDHSLKYYIKYIKKNLSPVSAPTTFAEYINQ